MLFSLAFTWKKLCQCAAQATRMFVLSGVGTCQVFYAFWYAMLNTVQNDAPLFRFQFFVEWSGKATKHPNLPFITWYTISMKMSVENNPFPSRVKSLVVHLFFTHKMLRLAQSPIWKASQGCECACVDIAITLKLLGIWKENRKSISHAPNLLACPSIYLFISIYLCLFVSRISIRASHPPSLPPPPFEPSREAPADTPSTPLSDIASQ